MAELSTRFTTRFTRKPPPFMRGLLPAGLLMIGVVMILAEAAEGRLTGPGGVALKLLVVVVAVLQTVLLMGSVSAIGRERALRREVTKAEARYRTLVEQQPGVVYLAEPGALGRWHYVSPQIEGMLGFTAEEWTRDASLWAQQVHPDDHDRVMTADTAAFESERPQRFEYRMLSRDGREVWVLDELNPTHPDPDQPALLQGILLDITEQKRSEAALRGSEEQQRVIIETATYAFVGMDERGCIVEWNQQAERIFGWTREEVLTQPLDELIIPAAQTRGPPRRPEALPGDRRRTDPLHAHRGLGTAPRRARVSGRPHDLAGADRRPRPLQRPRRRHHGPQAARGAATPPGAP